MFVEKYQVRIRLTEKLLGTVPMNEGIWAEYIAKRAPTQEVVEEELDYDEYIEKMEEKGLTGFFRNEEGIFIMNYMVKGFLKHAGNVMKDMVKVKNLKSKLNDFVFVEPRQIPIGKKERDGILERPLRGNTPQGQIVSIARSEYINEGTEITFTIKLLPHKEITMDIIKQLFEYGELKGLGQFRNGSYGCFEVLSFESIKDTPKKKTK